MPNLFASIILSALPPSRGKTGIILNTARQVFKYMAISRYSDKKKQPVFATINASIINMLERGPLKLTITAFHPPNPVSSISAHSPIGSNCIEYTLCPNSMAVIICPNSCSAIETKTKKKCPNRPKIHINSNTTGNSKLICISSVGNLITILWECLYSLKDSPVLRLSIFQSASENPLINLYSPLLQLLPPVLHPGLLQQLFLNSAHIL